MRNLLVFITAPSGERFRMRYDGVQDFTELGLGLERQYTALEEIPGLAPKHGTTYARSISERGFAVEPEPETQGDHERQV